MHFVEYLVMSILFLADFIFVDLVPRRLEMKTGDQRSFCRVHAASERMENQARVAAGNGHRDGVPKDQYRQDDDQGQEQAAETARQVRLCIHATKLR